MRNYDNKALTRQDGFPAIDFLHRGDCSCVEVSVNEEVESALVECFHGDHTNCTIVGQQV